MDRPWCLLASEFFDFSRLAPHARISWVLTVVPTFYSYIFSFFIFLNFAYISTKINKNQNYKKGNGKKAWDTSQEALF